MKKFTILNSFAIKIIAMVTMAIDHLGVVFSSLWGSYTNPVFFTVCRYIGRFAMPLYCFMLVEGVLHTRSYKKYALRLGIMAIIITSFLAVVQYVPSLGLSSLSGFGNIFLDLLLGSVMIYCLNHKNKYVKLIAIIPIGISIFSFLAKAFEYSSSCIECGVVGFYAYYPRFLRLQYDWLSIGLMLGYFLSYQMAKVFYKIREEETGLSSEMMVGTSEYRITVNLFAIIFTILVSALYYLIYYFNKDFVWWDHKMQLFAVLVGFIILLYNGERGYNKKWFNIFSYLYYPVHILLIYGICYLIYIL